MNKSTIKLKNKKELYPHQAEALEAVRKGFETADRGQLLMACGTGKTFTSLKIAEEHAGKNGLVLFLVPSLSLLSQTLREWLTESAIPLHCYAICSDTKVGKHDEGDPTTPDDLAIPATTSGAELSKSFADWTVTPGYNDKMTVFFSTYQSIETIHESQKKHSIPEFDLIICDEAHRTTGAKLEGTDESHFVKVHDAGFLQAKKRLYMTATPRLYSADSQKKAKEREVPIWSMDNESHYGNVFYSLGFSQAVSEGLLSDYKVLILGVDERVASDLEAAATATPMKSSAKKKELSLVDPAKMIGCWHALAGQYALDALDALDDREDRGNRRKPILHRAVAFTTSIKQSQMFQSQFDQIITEYHKNSSELLVASGENKKDSPLSTHHSPLCCKVQHVDGMMNVLERNERLQWLKNDFIGTPLADTLLASTPLASAPLANTPGRECRLLSNARCLSEGVDVPALDAVIFLTPRKSKVDVVQSVGRVMRKAEGKEYGYIILPVVIKAGTAPEDVLNDHEAYEMVWGVLQALRAHDDRFQNQINVFELDGKEPEKIEIHFIGTATASHVSSERPKPNNAPQICGFTDDDIKLWKNALYAALVKKCGEKRYWEEWAKDVAQLAERHIKTLQKLTDDEAHRCGFRAFLEHLRSHLNDSITEQEAVEMLAQHIITKPVFDALFDSEDFSKNNPVALGLDKVVSLLEEATEHFEAEYSAKDNRLGKFYESVRKRVEGVKTAEGRQKIVIELYDKFFKTAFPKLSDKLGIVYTPVEVVDFIIKSADQALRQEFGVGIGAKNIHVLDPFTGTGTFIVRLLQSGLIDPKDLYRKYHKELHANEIVLLAYYIAAINIENTYHEQNRNRKIAQQQSQSCDCGSYDCGSCDCVSEPFPGIVHTDTFAMTWDKKIVDDTNSERARKQKKTPISVIIGNPPYSVGQKSQNDNNKNVSYPRLDRAIRDSYAAHSTATNKTSLYDSYIRAFRWASDRIGDQGIICYVTNGGFIDSKAMDGFRKCLADEFTGIYIFNLRGGIRGRSGDAAKKEGKNIFPIMTAVAITLLVKNPAKKGSATILYYDIGDYKDRNVKLQILADADGLCLGNIQEQVITPNDKHDWINQRGELFDTFPLLGDKKNKDTETIFDTYSGGVQTNRDSWCWNFSRDVVRRNMACMIQFYNIQVAEYELSKSCQTEKIDIDQFVSPDPTKISWTRSLKSALSKSIKHSFDPKNVVCGIYRPFCKQYIYYNRVFNEYVNKMPQIFPEPGMDNVVICMSGSGAVNEFCATISETLPDVEMVEKMQCFPFYIYKQTDNIDKQTDKQSHVHKNAPFVSQSDDCGSDGTRFGNYLRRENISDTMWRKFREHYSNSKITKKDIFYYVYGVLHSRCYRERFAAHLKKQLPRIPFVEDFWTFSKAGRRLAELHLNYETGKMFPLVEKTADDSPQTANHKVVQMRFPSKTDKSKIIYNTHLTLEGIPPETYRYIVNGKSALDWIIERYTVTTHRDSGIINDPNNWCHEIGNERYIVDLIKRIVALSVESVKIIEGLPKLAFE